MKHDDALSIAESVVEILRPACGQIEIAGSVRRGKPDVKDIEIVAVPNLVPPARPRPEFGKPMPVAYKTVLDLIVSRQCELGPFSGRWALKKNGEKYKQIYLVEHEIAVDLFLVTPPAMWGVQFAIRTGPADFSHWIVTRQRNGGALPNGYRVQDGAVWEGAAENETDNLVGFFSEIDFLQFLGLGWIEPGERVARWAK